MWREDFCCLLILILSALPSKSTYWGNIRLVDGDTPFDGRPEVFTEDDWQPFCDSFLHPNVARAICRMLRMPTNNVTLKSNKYVDNWDTWIACDEEDTDLMMDCYWQIWPDTDCWQDKGLSCNGNVRLLHGTNDNNGNLELFHNGILTSICDSDPDFKLARVVCRQLGLEIGRSALTLGSYFGRGHPGTLQVTCGGNEVSVEQCQFHQMPCTSTHVIGVDCNATRYDLEVVHVDSGIISVDINTYAAAGYWSERLAGVSADPLLHKRNIASVLCYELGYSRYDPGILEIPFDERFAYPRQLSVFFVCSGLEDSLSECSLKDSPDGDQNYENSFTEIAITCNDALKLQDGVNHYNGILVRRNDTDGKWQPFADIRPDHAMAAVACKELGYNSSSVGIQLKKFEAEDVSSIEVEYICSGEELLLRDCQTNYGNDRRRSKAVIGLNCNATDTALTEIPSRTNSGYVKHLFGQRVDGQERSSWSRVCNSEMTYDVNTAGIICHQLGYTRSGAKITLLPLTEDSDFLDDIARYACVGSEESLSQCPIYAEFSQRKCRFDVSMTCQDLSLCKDTDIKLPSKVINCHDFDCKDGLCYSPVYGAAPCLLDIGQGCMISKTYVKSNARAVLKSMIGYCNPSCKAAFSRTTFTYRSDECCYKEMCNSNKTVVRDEELFRLVGGILHWEGFVQFYSKFDKKWIYIHEHTSITNEIIEAFCVRSGYFPNSFARSPNTGKAYPYDEMCILPGSEGGYTGNCSVQDLSSSCFMSQVACPEKYRLRINCNAYAPVARLVDGGLASKGRVELYFLNRWGTVCTRGISQGVSDVLCRSLGFHGGCSLNTTSGTNRARFPAGDGSIHFENVSCVGNEESILQCKYSYVNENSDCTHQDDLGIICEDAYSEAGTVEEIYVTPVTSEDREGFVNDAVERVFTSTVTDMIKEQTTSMPSTNTSLVNIDENNYLPKVVSCFEGQCIKGDCGDILTRQRMGSVCTANQSDYCYVEEQETKRISEKVLKFGCLSNCVTGESRNTIGQIRTRFCCTSELCNVFSDVATNQIVEIVNEANTTKDSIELGTATQETLLTNVNGTNTTDIEIVTSQGVVNTASLWMVVTQIVYMSAVF